MSKAAFFNLPLYGHVNPTLEVMKSLVEKGEDVVCFTSYKFKLQVEGTGARFFGIDADLATHTARELSVPLNMGVLLLEITSQILPQLLKAVGTERIDYVVCDSMCPWGRFVARLSNLPMVLSFHAFVIRKNIVPPTTLAAQFDIDHPAQSQEAASRFKALRNQLDVKYGLRNTDLVSLFLEEKGELNLVSCIRRMQPSQTQLDDSFVFTGIPIQDRSGESAPLPLEMKTKPLLYISMGTIAEGDISFYNLCLDTFGASKYTVVISIGEKLDVNAFSNVPSNVIIRNHVPQTGILKYADAFITHGGMNSVNEAIFFEVPLIVFPQFGDQFLVAIQVWKNKLGSILDPRKLNRSYLESLVETTAGDATIKDSLRLMKAEAMESGGAKRSAEEILGFALKKGLPQSAGSQFQGSLSKPAVFDAQ